ncbi:hypothetical protein [Caballeronia sp. LZ001]|uniref:hypothetical protein n=1 Tax=Caballeronia sp. LZ001 TaxID=3038553 RepID=UPI002867717E|nr:hypothetical protein [Caballeronia sp. LZ001]MDR5800057.1 hypothetical protein [Caballeronia sp. LZ001]MDR5801919.1 hypothetical protein [Caballeronia sp. LZ001]MDR5805284.1 hypothetical protein [Caballeronia sp. LZ001]
MSSNTSMNRMEQSDAIANLIRRQAVGYVGDISAYGEWVRLLSETPPEVAAYALSVALGGKAYQQAPQGRRCRGRTGCCLNG